MWQRSMGVGFSSNESPTSMYGGKGESGQRNENEDLSEAKRLLRAADHQFCNGQLFDIHRNSTFVFNQFAHQSQNQKRYEHLGKIIEKYVYGLLQDKSNTGLQLVKRYLPLSSSLGLSNDFIFHTKDIEKYEKILILMHGSGVVRAGQWSRKLIMNVSVDAGSMLPYVRKAHQYGYGVVVVNINQPYDHRSSMFRSPEDHFNYVWKNVIEKIPHAPVAIVTHSFGGSVVMNAAKNIPSFMRRTFAVALTDCWVSDSLALRDWLQTKVCNWVTSHLPLGQNVQRSHHGTHCKTVSGGTTVHEETPWKAFEDVWKFIHQKEKGPYQQNSTKAWSKAQGHRDERVGRAPDRKMANKRPASVDRKGATQTTEHKRSSSVNRRDETQRSSSKDRNKLNPAHSSNQAQLEKKHKEERVGRATNRNQFDVKPHLKHSTSLDSLNIGGAYDRNHFTSFDGESAQQTNSTKRSPSIERKTSSQVSTIKRFSSHENLSYLSATNQASLRASTKKGFPPTMGPLTLFKRGKKPIQKKQVTPKRQPLRPPYATDV